MRYSDCHVKENPLKKEKQAQVDVSNWMLKTDF